MPETNKDHQKKGRPNQNKQSLAVDTPEQSPETSTTNHTNKQSVEEILLNLKIIGAIKRQDRLSKNEDNILEIENNDILQAIRRWWCGRSRNETITSIKKIIQSAFQVTDSTLNRERGFESENQDTSAFFNEENSNQLQRFVIEMTSCLKGLDNLKNTYQEDVRITSEIDILKEQLQLRIRKINSILKINL